MAITLVETTSIQSWSLLACRFVEISIKTLAGTAASRARWLRPRRLEAQTLALSDHQLRDMGVLRSDIDFALHLQAKGQSCPLTSTYRRHL